MIYIIVALLALLAGAGYIIVRLGNENQKLEGEYIRTRNAQKKAELDYQDHMRDAHLGMS